jgi:hypothetical protein
MQRKRKRKKSMRLNRRRTKIQTLTWMISSKTYLNLIMMNEKAVDTLVVKQSFITENNSKRTLPTTLRSCQTNKKAKTQEAIVPIVFAQLKH